MAKDFVILGKSVAPGESALVHLDVAKLHTRTDVKVPIIVERARKKVLCCCFSGGYIVKSCERISTLVSSYRSVDGKNQ